MRTRILAATLAGALLLFGAPHGAFAQGAERGGGGNHGRCGYDDGCTDRGDHGASDPSQRWWNCRYDPYRDNYRDRTPCRYSEECTNYPRCKD